MDREVQEFICYSLPGSTEIVTALVDRVEWVNELPSQITCDFIVAPFNKSKYKSGLLWLNQVQSDELNSLGLIKSNAQSEISFASYKDQFDAIIDQLDSGHFNKIVLSRTQHFKYDNYNAIDVFTRLANEYPDAFVYFINLQGTGCWMGASPELLLNHQNGNWKTVALAGTKEQNSITGSLSWTEKELDEQQIILDFLSQEFSSKNIHCSIGKKYVVNAGEVAHIKTDIQFESDAPLHEILDVIHPGPAISGMPKQKSIDFIDTLEEHDRSYYAGFLGPIGVNVGNTQLFVNLRCMKLTFDGVELYLGGGIVKGSEVQSEWDETNLKAQTLLKVLMPETNLSA